MPATKRALRSTCPIAGTLDLLGDRWSLLILRDLFIAPRRYGDFTGAEERIPTNILADRLVRLEEAGLLSSERYQANPPRYTYTLTATGRDLKPVLAALSTWGQKYVRGTRLRAAVVAALEA